VEPPLVLTLELVVENDPIKMVMRVVATVRLQHLPTFLRQHDGDVSMAI
jgi:hypothetical protein